MTPTHDVVVSNGEHLTLYYDEAALLQDDLPPLHLMHMTFLEHPRSLDDQIVEFISPRLSVRPERAGGLLCPGSDRSVQQVFLSGFVIIDGRNHVLLALVIESFLLRESETDHLVDAGTLQIGKALQLPVSPHRRPTNTANFLRADGVGQPVDHGLFTFHEARLSACRTRSPSPLSLGSRR